MLLLTFFIFLVPVVFADLQERTINNYVVKIDGNTLKSVQPTETSSRVLNLSGLALQLLEKDVFANLSTVKNLDLGNNSLPSIPNGLFSKLENLEHLSLADNNITKFEKSFEGLEHLKTLNISNNPLTDFGGTDLFGLPKSSVIFTKGLSISTINPYVFEKEMKSPDDDEDQDEEDEDDDEDDDYIQIPPNATQEQNVTSATQEIRKKREVEDEDEEEDEEYHQIKICIDGDVLKIVAPLKPNETLPSGCQSSNLTEDRDYLSLENLGIAKFEKSWYQLDDNVEIDKINFSGNKIVQVTRELLNDLPSDVRFVDLSGNKIERLSRGIIRNKYIGTLKLDSNKISEIETGALANLRRLHALFLQDNFLTDTKFVATLPKYVSMMQLKNNRITEITSGSFSRLNHLFSLYLDGNLIQEVKSDSLHGLLYLIEIGLSSNQITKIEPGSFQRSKSLFALDISNNSIAGFERDVFDRRSRLVQLDVSHNKLANLTDNFPDGLPYKLRHLQLGFNEIEMLKCGDFKNLTKLAYLLLEGNKISEIEPGSFDLPFLRKMSLEKNLLNELNIESFQGLKGLKNLSLDGNGITNIPKGFMKNMPELEKLELSNNPIKRLQNGALSGFRSTIYNLVYLNKVPIEVIEGGLFDDL